MRPPSAIADLLVHGPGTRCGEDGASIAAAPDPAEARPDGPPGRHRGRGGARMHRYHRRGMTGTAGDPAGRCPGPSLCGVMRLLGVLALAAPVALGILLVAVPEVAASWVDDREPFGHRRGRLRRPSACRSRPGSLLPADAVRLGRLVKAAERIAAGDYAVTVQARGNGLEGRLARADQRHRRRPRRDARPRDHRPPDRRRQPPAPCSAPCSPRSSAPAATSGRCRSPSSTSTTSRPSTTRTATPPATSSCAASPRRSARTCGRPT